MAKMNRAFLDCTYNNKNISAGLAPHTLSFSYTDNEGGKADDLNIQLEDSQGLWKDAWLPRKGAVITAVIRTEGNRQLNCGTFAVDQVDLSGPPDTVTLKAVSSFTAKSLKQEKKSRSWEKITLEAVAKEIADEHSLGFFYSVSELVGYARLDQREESDLAFLKRLCKDQDCNLKLSGEKLIIFESRTLEQIAPAFTLTRGKDPISRFSFSTKTCEIFRGCEVSYWDADKKIEQKHLFIPPGAPATGEVLKLNKRMESLADARSKARAALRRKNKQEVTGNLNLMGDTRLLSGLTFTLSGWGAFDGKYIVESASHNQTRDSGYQTGIKIRKVVAW